ncbi:hypothetical protein HYU93_04650 [Candidatus Daviesbacteria bacterium]|nr:hypothetical protein [Candidatus Daviesbacteria bacterium]
MNKGSKSASGWTKERLAKFKRNRDVLIARSKPYAELHPDALNPDNPIEAGRIDAEVSFIKNDPFLAGESDEHKREIAVERLGRRRELIIPTKDGLIPAVFAGPTSDWKPRSYFGSIGWTDEQEAKYQTGLERQSVGDGHVKYGLGWRDLVNRLRMPARKHRLTTPFTDKDKKIAAGAGIGSLAEYMARINRRLECYLDPEAVRALKKQKREERKQKESLEEELIVLSKLLKPETSISPEEAGRIEKEAKRPGCLLPAGILAALALAALLAWTARGCQGEIIAIPTPISTGTTTGESAAETATARAGLIATALAGQALTPTPTATFITSHEATATANAWLTGTAVAKAPLTASATPVAENPAPALSAGSVVDIDFTIRPDAQQRVENGEGFSLFGLMQDQLAQGVNPTYGQLVQERARDGSYSPEDSDILLGTLQAFQEKLNKMYGDSDRGNAVYTLLMESLYKEVRSTLPALNNGVVTRDDQVTSARFKMPRINTETLSRVLDRISSHVAVKPENLITDYSPEKDSNS